MLRGLGTLIRAKCLEEDLVHGKYSVNVIKGYIFMHHYRIVYKSLQPQLSVQLISICQPIIWSN